MSGYQAIDEPLLQLGNSTFVAFANLEKCVFVIQDGERIGRDKYTCARGIEFDTDIYVGVSNCMVSHCLRHRWSWLICCRYQPICNLHVPFRLDW
jgi:hypothetical protein